MKEKESRKSLSFELQASIWREWKLTVRERKREREKKNRFGSRQSKVHLKYVKFKILEKSA